MPQRDSGDGHGLEISTAELAMLLEGVDLKSARRRPRYRHPTAGTMA